MIKAGGDGVYGASFLTGVGFPAAQDWYATIASPHLTGGDTKAADFIDAYKKQFNIAPIDYSITAYDGTLVIIDSVKRVAESGKPVTRSAVRDAIQAAKVPTIQGTVSFDENGDLADRTVSVFQIKKDPNAPLDDVSAQYQYLEVAPQA
jgi:branched-chain amino acid transport system substrate-binding protein